MKNLYSESDFYCLEPDEIENEILTPIETMNFLCLGRSSFYHLVQTGELPAFRVGKQWRVSKSALLKYIERESLASL